MTSSSRHQDIEERFRELVAKAGLPAPDEAAHLRRAVAFLWYESEAFVLVDLAELPEDEDPFEGLDTDQLGTDILGDPLSRPNLPAPPGPFPPKFSQTG